MSYSEAQVLALAPDDKAIKAGQKQSSPSLWSSTGSSERALWGLCQGSGSKPYQTIVDLANPAEPAFKCSCPSRKFPCKHGLGLMLLWISSPGTLPAGEPSDFATEWLEGRDQRSAKKEAKRAEVAADPDKALAAARKRQAKREQRINDGLDELELWLSDLIRHGLAAAAQRPRSDFAQMAARLVDAQAPGLAKLVSELGNGVGVGSDWALSTLAAAGRLHMLICAYRRADELPAGLRGDVRALVGWTLSADELALVGTKVRDRWRVLAQVSDTADKLRERRTWLHGRDSGHYALLLDYAHPTQSFAAAPLPDTVVDAELTFYPATQPLRASIGAFEQASGPVSLLSADDVAEAYRLRATTWAANPWQEHVPTSVQAVPVREDGRWWLADASHEAIALHPEADTQAQALAALSGGQPICVFGEWRRRGLMPLAIDHDGESEAL